MSEKLVSNCCGAEIEIHESEMPDSGFRMTQYLGYQCLKCKKPTNPVSQNEFNKPMPKGGKG